jgi:ATP-dependent DNA helicase RecG
MLLNYIKKNPSQRVAHFEEHLKIPTKTLERWIKQLREGNKIEFRGSKKTGGYFAK